MASSQSFSMIQRRMLLSPWPASPVNRELPLWTSAIRLPSGVVPLHLGELVGQEEHLAVAAAGDEGVLGVVAVLDLKARIVHVLLAAHALEVRLPALAVGRVREHEVELAGWEGVVRESGVFRAADDVVGGLAFALEQQVGLADGVGLRVDLLAEEVGGDLLAALGGELTAGRPRRPSGCRRCRRRHRRACMWRTESGRRPAGRRGSPSV